MRRRHVTGFAVRIATALIVLVGAAAPAQGQAWVPAKGEGTVSVLFSNVLSREHHLPDEKYDLGHIDANTLLFDVTYGITDRVAVTVGLPVVVSRYRGNFPHRPITWDDAQWHTAAQDFRLGLRYNVIRGPLMVTPFVGSELPSHDYEFFTHAAPGRGLQEINAGLAAGRLFAELGLVVQGRYSLAFSERALEDFPRRYSLAAVETAYFLTPSIRLLAMTAARIGHTGIDLYPDSSRVLPFEIFYEHDRISRESYWNVGGGAGVSLTDTVDLYGSFTRTITGRNTHAVNRGVSIGLSWSFGGSGSAALASRSTREGALVRCLCQKDGG
jgi:hypothetical protein